MEIFIVLASILACTTATPGLFFPGPLNPGVFPGPGIGFGPDPFASGPIGQAPFAAGPLSPLGPIISTAPAYLPSAGIAVGAPSIGYDYASIGGAPAFISNPGFDGSGLSISAPLSVGAIDRGGVMYSPTTATGIDRTGALYSPAGLTYGPSAGLTSGSTYPGFFLRGPATGMNILGATGIAGSRSTGGAGASLSRVGTAVGTDLIGSSGSAASLGTTRRVGESVIGDRLRTVNSVGPGVGGDIISGSGSNSIGISEGRSVRVSGDIMGAGGSLNSPGLNTMGTAGRGDITSSSGLNSIRISEGRGLQVGSDGMGASSNFDSLGLNAIGAARHSDIIASGGRNGIILERGGVGSDFMGMSSGNSLGLNTFGSARRSDIGFDGSANSIGTSERSGLGVMAGGSRLNSIGLNTLPSASRSDIGFGGGVNSIGTSERSGLGVMAGESGLSSIGLNTVASASRSDILSGSGANRLGISERTSLRVRSDALSAGGGFNSLGTGAAGDIASGTSLDVGAMRNDVTGGAFATGMGPSSGLDIGLTEAGTGSSFSGSGTADSAGLFNSVGISERGSLRVGTLPDGISGGGATADIGAGTALDTASGSSTGLGPDPLAGAMNAIAGAGAPETIGPGLTADVGGGSLDATLGISGGDRLSGMTGGSSVVDRMQFTNSGPLRNTEFFSGGAGTESVGIASGAQ